MTAIQVKTNTFEITELPRSKYKQYDAWSTPDNTEVFAHKKNQLFYHLMDKVDPDFFNPRMIFDGRALAYTPTSKDMGPGRQWTVSLGSTTIVEPNTRGAVTIRITSTSSSIVDPKHVYDLIQDRKFSERSSVATNLLQLIVRQASNMNNTNNGRAYFTEARAQSLRSQPFELWHGIWQSVRPTIGRMVLNVDRASAVVHKRGRLEQACMEFLKVENMRSLAIDERSAEFKKLESHLKGLEIEIPAMGPSRHRRKKIRGLIAAAGEYRFRNEEGRKLSVAEYYKMTYGRTIQYPRIVGVRLTGKDHPRPQVVPLEVCNIVPGQIFKKKLPDALVAEMVRFSSIKPAERLQCIQMGVERHQTSVPMAEAGMKIDPRPILVDGRMLGQPALRYLSNQITPQGGAWNMMKSKFFAAKPLEYWAVINFCSVKISSDNVGDIMRMIKQCCMGLGMACAPAITSANGNPQNVKGTLDDVMTYIVRNKPPNKDLKELLQGLVLIILLPEHGGPIKTLVKYWGDIHNGIKVICTKENKLQANLKQSQYFNNVLLKINARLGGQNAIVECHVLKQLSASGKFMIMGADVGHPGVGVRRPSTTSLVYSRDAYATDYVALMGIQSPRVELIEDLHDYVEKAVYSFETKNGLPQRIIFFRDGLSEGEFDKVARWEVSEIKRAVKSVFKRNDPKFSFPKITYIVVGKRHHITLYPDIKEHGDKNGNCKPGTVVLSGITHPVERDFYLQSHAAIQGTARSAHYTIIQDEIFGPNGIDQIQRLAYSLCHVYAKATRSVSIPAPVYYADLVCSRLDYHIDPRAQETLFGDGSTTASGSTPFNLSQWKENFKNIHPELEQSMYFL